MKMKKFFALLMAGIMTAGMLAGCGGSEDQAAQASDPAPDTELSFIVSLTFCIPESILIKSSHD